MVSRRSSTLSSGTMDYEELHAEEENYNQRSQQRLSQQSSPAPPSSVYEFQRENGRTYHGYRAGAYAFPNDSAEVDRLDHQHAILQHLFSNQLHFAPLDASQSLKLLDIGTGTGIWAIEMGDAYPNFLIQGTDLSPIQPTFIPPNVEFFVDDASEPDWGVSAEHFDYIHTRCLHGCFESFKGFLERAFYYTKPGGWVESQEISSIPFCDFVSMPSSWPFLEWSKNWNEAAKGHGRRLDIADNLKRWYQEIGFVDVQEKVFHLPVNGWRSDKQGKMLGRMSEENWLDGLGGFSLGLFSRVLGWSQDEIEVYLVNVRRAISDRSVQAYHKVYVVWGRKPFDNEK